MLRELLQRLFGGVSQVDTGENTISGLPRTSGEFITQIAEGSNLVDGLPTWENAEERKHDLGFMLRCCEAELAAMSKASIVAAPYYFEREVELCERYVREVNAHYQRTTTKEVANVRKGPRYEAIVARVPKAKKLLSRRKSET